MSTSDKRTAAYAVLDSSGNPTGEIVAAGKSVTAVTAKSNGDGGIGISVGSRPMFVARAVGFAAAGNLGNLSVPLVPPSAFGWIPPISAWRKNGEVIHDYKASDWMVPTTATLYVDVVNGNDTTGTGTAAAPYKSVDKAGSVMAADTTVYVQGASDRNNCWKGRAFAYNANVIGITEGVVLSTRWEGGTWTPTTNGTFSAARALVAGVVDFSVIGSEGVSVHLPKLASQAAVEASTGGAYYTDGTTVWVRTADGRSPDANVAVFLDIANGRLSTDKKLFVKNITFEGGGAGGFSNVDGTMSTNARQVFDNCTFRYACAADQTVGNGLSVVGCPLTILYNCRAYGNRADGLNYHKGSTNGIEARVVEIDCVSFANGLADGNNNDNATTIHEDGRIMRIRTVGKATVGPVFADINTSKSWNIDCVSLGSAGDPAIYSTAGFLALDTATQWLDNCWHEGGVGTATYKSPGAFQYSRGSTLPSASVATY